MTTAVQTTWFIGIEITYEVRPLHLSDEIPWERTFYQGTEYIGVSVSGNPLSLGDLAEQTNRIRHHLEPFPLVIFPQLLVG